MGNRQNAIQRDKGQKQHKRGNKRSNKAYPDRHTKKIEIMRKMKREMVAEAIVEPKGELNPNIAGVEIAISTFPNSSIFQDNVDISLIFPIL